MPRQSRPLKDRTAIVTGASRGIGFATAQELARCGARVALFARSPAPLKEAAERIGHSALPIEADVSDPGSVRKAFAVVDQNFGRLDILINNAAIGRLHKLEHASDSDLLDAVGTNVLGPIYCMREAIGRMKAGDGGDIVNISSESVRNPFPYLSIYAATKGALEVLSLAMRRELQPDKIRVTLFRSGASSAGFMREWDPQMAQQALQEWNERGFLQFAGAPLPPEVIADSIVHVLTRPPGANVDTLELRSS